MDLNQLGAQIMFNPGLLVDVFGRRWFIISVSHTGRRMTLSTKDQKGRIIRTEVALVNPPTNTKVTSATCPECHRKFWSTTSFIWE